MPTSQRVKWSSCRSPGCRGLTAFCRIEGATSRKKRRGAGRRGVGVAGLTRSPVYRPRINLAKQSAKQIASLFLFIFLVEVIGFFSIQSRAKSIVPPGTVYRGEMLPPSMLRANGSRRFLQRALQKPAVRAQASTDLGLPKCVTFLVHYCRFTLSEDPKTKKQTNKTNTCTSRR